MNLASLFFHGVASGRDGVEFIDTERHTFLDAEKALIWQAFDVVDKNPDSTYHGRPRVPRKVDGSFNHIVCIKWPGGYGIKRCSWEYFHHTNTIEELLVYIDSLFSDQRDAI